MEEDRRVCGTDDMIALASRSRNFARSVDRNGLAKILDPDGVHLLAMLLWGHNMDKANAVLHHRVRVYCKVKGSDEPTEFQMDIRDDDWKKLHPAETFKELTARLAASEEG